MDDLALAAFRIILSFWLIAQFRKGFLHGLMCISVLCFPISTYVLIQMYAPQWEVDLLKTVAQHNYQLLFARSKDVVWSLWSFGRQVSGAIETMMH